MNVLKTFELRKGEQISDMNAAVRVLGQETVMAARAVKGIVYVASPNPCGGVQALVCQVIRETTEDNHKIISIRILLEDEALEFTDCPADILDRLTPTISPERNAWREACRRNCNPPAQNAGFAQAAA